jgi:uncharacterized protein (TIGR02265 family)
MAEYSTFEGLFVRGLEVDEAFAAELKKVGFDIHNPRPRYPAKVWRDSLDLAQRRYFPDLGAAEGRKALGNTAFEGFLSTLVGRFMAAALSTLVTPPALIRKMPRFFQMARPGIEVSVAEEAPTRWRGVWRDPNPDPYFSIGLIEAAGKRTRSSFRAELDKVNPDGFELLFRWD